MSIQVEMFVFCVRKTSLLSKAFLSSGEQLQYVITVARSFSVLNNPTERFAPPQQVVTFSHHSSCLISLTAVSQQLYSYYKGGLSSLRNISDEEEEMQHRIFCSISAFALLCLVS